jgi:hypothetical protein
MRNTNASPRSNLRAALVASALWAFAVIPVPFSFGGDQAGLPEVGEKAPNPEVGGGWSEKVNGLRSRMSLEREVNSPFLKVFIELQNTADVAGSRKIRFTPKILDFRVTDAAKNPLAKAIGPYDGISPFWEPLLLPMEGTLRFRISFPGLGYRPETDHTILDLGPMMSWVIPEDKDYFLSGTFTIPKMEGDHPYMDWSGTLTLPSIRIPQANKGEAHGAANPGVPLRPEANQTPAAPGSGR